MANVIENYLYEIMTLFEIVQRHEKLSLQEGRNDNIEGCCSIFAHINYNTALLCIGVTNTL